jgi:acyl dehydratase
MPPDVGPAQFDLPLENAPIPAVISLTEEYFLPIRLGDRIRYSTTLDSISPLKKTRVGPGYFITTTNRYFNQHGELVGTSQYVLFRYRLSENK